MPNLDGTGPLGQGPKTGRGMGDCSNDRVANTPRPMGAGRGAGRGVGRGVGRGAGRGAGRGVGRGVGRSNA